MIRTFCTNRIRECEELSDSLWDFSPCSGEHEGEIYKVAVPCCWENLPDFASYRGVGAFTKRFKAEGNIRLVFKGVSHTAKVYVDGEEVGRHYNAYTPFSIVVKGLESGEHELKVLADNSFGEESALHVPNDYMSYGGITRGVVLEQLKDSYIEYIHAVPERKEDGWTVKVSVKVDSIAECEKKVHLEFRMETKDGCDIHCSATEEGQCGLDVEASSNGSSLAWDFTLGAGEDTVLTGEMHFKDGDVKEWDIESPDLYMVSAFLSDEEGLYDDLTDRMGFREVKVCGRDILLNGKKLRIKGFCRHEDHPMYGCALPFSAMQQDIEIIKDLGANAVRTSHYPNDELFLDLCDEQGILLWEENHARGLSLEQMQNPNFERQAEDCIREMITAHINHPSIIIWGILNECASDTEYGYECYKKQYDLIRSMDTSRPRSSASCKFKTDICFGLPDIVSYNIYPEWYVNAPAAEYLKDLYDWVQNESEGSGKPFLITEIGAGAIYGYRTPTECKWSEEYQAKALRDQITAVLNQEGVSGIFIWQYCDVRISFEWFNNRPRTMNNKGVVDEYRRRKMAYDVVKELYHEYGNYR